jgi:hypothetical protein
MTTVCSSSLSSLGSREAEPRFNSGIAANLRRTYSLKSLPRDSVIEDTSCMKSKDIRNENVSKATQKNLSVRHQERRATVSMHHNHDGSHGERPLKEQGSGPRKRGTAGVDPAEFNADARKQLDSLCSRDKHKLAMKGEFQKKEFLRVPKTSTQRSALSIHSSKGEDSEKAQKTKARSERSRSSGRSKDKKSMPDAKQMIASRGAERLARLGKSTKNKKKRRVQHDRHSVDGNGPSSTSSSLDSTPTQARALVMIRRTPVVRHLLVVRLQVRNPIQSPRRRLKVLGCTVTVGQVVVVQKATTDVHDPN